MQFYVYQHQKADTNEIFYVGKGTGNRAINKSQRTKYWKNVEAKHGRIVKFIAKELDEELAFLCEIEAIDAYRRRGIKLVNLSNGGDGPTGNKLSEEAKRRIGLPKKGIPRSEEVKNKIRQALLGKPSSFKGKHHTKEAKEQISISLKKRLNNG